MFSLMRITQKKLELIDEQKSPLFRIMSVYNDEEVQNRKFDNNMCAFHIGNGLILSVAHNLRINGGVLYSIPEQIYQEQIIQKLSSSDIPIFNKNFITKGQLNKRYLDCKDQGGALQLDQKLRDIRFDRRFLSMYKNNICKPFLIIQFRNNIFYSNQAVSSKINSNYIFYENKLFRHTFLIELKLIEAFYGQDIAVYKIINTDSHVINMIPYIKLDFRIYDKLENNFFCLQSAPVDNLGRLLNKSRIEGILDHWNYFHDDLGGGYTLEGLRYLIQGYFRFGSSGAPYLKYDFFKNEFRVNAIQSEASPIQLSINNNRHGNFQYVNAIASPLKIVENELKKIINAK